MNSIPSLRLACALLCTATTARFAVAAPPPPSDPLAARAEAAIQTRLPRAADAIRVGHDADRLVLTGTVDFYADRQLAEQAHQADADVARDVRTRLADSPLVNARDIDVTVRRGVATLSGTVSDWPQRTAATQNALAAGVINMLRVVPSRQGG